MISICVAFLQLGNIPNNRVQYVSIAPRLVGKRTFYIVWGWVSITHCVLANTSQQDLLLLWVLSFARWQPQPEHSGFDIFLPVGSMMEGRESTRENLLRNGDKHWWLAYPEEMIVLSLCTPSIIFLPSRLSLPKFAQSINMRILTLNLFQSCEKR